jgi:hypothetical protein
VISTLRRTTVLASLAVFSAFCVGCGGKDAAPETATTVEPVPVVKAGPPSPEGPIIPSPVPSLPATPDGDPTPDMPKKDETKKAEPPK